MNVPDTIDRREILLAAIFLTLMILICGGLGIYVLSDPGLQRGYVLTNAARQIDSWYHEAVDWTEVVEGAQRGMIGMLDRFSGYVTDAEFDRMHEDQSGGYSGIGVTIAHDDRGLLVLNVREGGPADQVGIVPGDVIMKADSIDLKGLLVRTSSSYLRGDDDTKVALTIYRPVDDDTTTLTLTRGRVSFEHIPFAGYTGDSVLYIKLVDFGPGASADVEAALDSLVVDPEITPRGVILDMRGNPGGLLLEAYHTANLFLDDGKFIVGTDARSRWNSIEHYATDEDLTGGVPMMVIVDDGSASAAEIVAGALQQTGRAQLVGDTTYGKGLVQGFVHFADADGLRLTIARYYVAGGVYLNDFDSTLNEIGHGLNPDHFFAFVDQDDFPQTVEASLLLHQFAYRYQAEILAAGDDTLADDWLDRFYVFASERDFEYISASTLEAENLLAIARLEGSRDVTLRTIENFLTQNRHRDLVEYQRYSTYLKARFCQLAIQRQRSRYEAFREVVIPRQPEIKFAREILTSFGYETNHE
jgi:carboxyl-terminal processing protease